MKKLKKNMILAALAFPALSMAAEFPWLTFQMADGSEMSVAADGLVINYADGNLLLKSATVDRIFATDQVKSMRFTTTSADVDGIMNVLATESVYFDLSGKEAGRFNSQDEAQKTLPSGTYIVRNNGKSVKVIF